MATQISTRRQHNVPRRDKRITLLASRQWRLCLSALVGTRQCKDRDLLALQGKPVVLRCGGLMRGAGESLSSTLLIPITVSRENVATLPCSNIFKRCNIFEKTSKLGHWRGLQTHAIPLPLFRKGIACHHHLARQLAGPHVQNFVACTVTWRRYTATNKKPNRQRLG